MGQNTVNCVTVGWQAVCYFNSCPFISFLLSLTNFLSFLAPLVCSHISYPCALHPPHPPPTLISPSSYLPWLLTPSIHILCLSPFRLSSQFLSSHITFYFTPLLSTFHVLPCSYQHRQAGREQSLSPPSLQDHLREIDISYKIHYVLINRE